MTSGEGPCLLCLGGPLSGDDAIALLVGEELARRGVRVGLAPDTSRLLDLLSEPADYVVVDAAVGITRGSVEEVTARALLRSAPAVSSHGLDVEVVLTLATRLWTAPGSVRLIGIGLGESPRLDAVSTDLRSRLRSIADDVFALAVRR